MKYQLLELEENVKVCLVYIDEYDDELKKIVENNFLEVIKGKQLAEREEFYDNLDSYKDAAKYILKKDKIESAKVGIIGEFLFHCFMRLECISSEYFSCCPTIGYSDTYQGFFKGFDGCYYSSDGIWITEVKAKVKSSKLDKDNKEKLTKAANQINDEVSDTKINRWEKTKGYVLNQLTREQIDEKKIYRLLTKEGATNYNKILGTMLICSSDDFDVDYIKQYVNELKDLNVKNQKLFLMCIRNFDHEKLLEYIQSKYGDDDE